MSSGRDWRPRALREGNEPDARFTLANERTFLAWIRTAIGLIAAAVALETFGGDVVGPGVRTVVACVLGVVVLGFMRFAPGPAPVVVTIGLVCLAPVLVLLVGGRARHRARVRSFVAGRAPYDWWTNLVLAATVVTLALSAAALIVVGR